jgi:hypothetical protein
VRSTTFLFTTFCTSIQIFGVLSIQTGVQWHKVGPVDAAPRRAYLGVRSPRVPSQGRLAPSQCLASRDASWSAPSRTRRALFTGLSWVPCARSGRGCSPYCELRPGCPVTVKARSPCPSIKQAAIGHPRACREPAVPVVRSPTVRTTSCRPVLRHTLPRPPKSYPHHPLPFPGRRLAGATAPAAAAA